ncbi:hypothetical protein MRX96_027668 [Rhipicephalus microplus]
MSHVRNLLLTHSALHILVFNGIVSHPSMYHRWRMPSNSFTWTHQGWSVSLPNAASSRSLKTRLPRPWPRPHARRGWHATASVAPSHTANTTARVAHICCRRCMTPASAQKSYPSRHSTTSQFLP